MPDTRTRHDAFDWTALVIKGIAVVALLLFDAAYFLGVWPWR